MWCVVWVAGGDGEQVSGACERCGGMTPPSPRLAGELEYRAELEVPSPASCFKSCTVGSHSGVRSFRGQLGEPRLHPPSRDAETLTASHSRAGEILILPSVVPSASLAEATAIVRLEPQVGGRMEYFSLFLLHLMTQSHTTPSLHQMDQRQALDLTHWAGSKPLT